MDVGRVQNVAMDLSPNQDQIVLEFATHGLFCSGAVGDVKFEIFDISGKQKIFDSETIRKEKDSHYKERFAKWTDNNTFEYTTFYITDISKCANKESDLEIQTFTLDTSKSQQEFCPQNQKLYTNSQYPEMRICYDQSWSLDDDNDLEPLQLVFTKDGVNLEYSFYYKVPGSGVQPCGDFQKKPEILEKLSDTLFRLKTTDTNKYVYTTVDFGGDPEDFETCPDYRLYNTITHGRELTDTQQQALNQGAIQEEWVTRDILEILLDNTDNQDLISKADQIVLNSCFSAKECEEVRERLAQNQEDKSTEKESGDLTLFLNIARANEDYNGYFINSILRKYVLCQLSGDRLNQSKFSDKVIPANQRILPLTFRDQEFELDCKNIEEELLNYKNASEKVVYNYSENGFIQVLDKEAKFNFIATQNYQEYAEEIKNILEQNKIQVNLEIVPDNQISQKIEQKQYHMILLSATIDTAEDLQLYYGLNGLNVSNITKNNRVKSEEFENDLKNYKLSGGEREKRLAEFFKNERVSIRVYDLDIDDSESEEEVISKSFDVSANWEVDASMINSDVETNKRSINFTQIQLSSNDSNTQYGEGKVWIVSHGWYKNPNSEDYNTNYMTDLAMIIADRNPDDTILLLDWRQASGYGDGLPTRVNHAAKWIIPTAKEAKAKLHQWGLTDPNKVNYIGHSLGTLMSRELSREMGGGDLAIMLDPPSQLSWDIGESGLWGYDLDGNTDGIQAPGGSLGGDDYFRSGFNFSRAFVGSQSIAGNQYLTPTAHEAFRIDFYPPNFSFSNAGDEHFEVIELYENMLEKRNIYNDYFMDKSNSPLLSSDAYPYGTEGLIYSEKDQNGESDKRTKLLRIEIMLDTSTVGLFGDSSSNTFAGTVEYRPDILAKLHGGYGDDTFEILDSFHNNYDVIDFSDEGDLLRINPYTVQKYQIEERDGKAYLHANHWGASSYVSGNKAGIESLNYSLNRFYNGFPQPDFAELN